MKIYEIFADLNQSELKKFKQFLASPFFNTNKKLRLFFSLLEKENIGKISQEREAVIFKKIYGKPIDRTKQKVFRNLKSKLIQKLNEFMAHQELCNNAKLTQKLLVDSYKSRNYKYFETHSKKLIAEIEEKIYLSVNDYFTLYQLYSDLWFHPDTNQKDTRNLAYQNLKNYFDSSFILGKLFLICEGINRASVLKEEKETLLLEKDILFHLKETKEANVKPLFYYYLQIINLQNNREAQPELFKQIKNSIFQNHKKIDDEIVCDLLILLLSQLEKLNALGSQYDSREDALEIYQFLFDNKILPLYGRIRNHDFINTLILAADILLELDGAKAKKIRGLG